MSDTAQKPSSTQLLELATTIANKTCHYLESSRITINKLQKLIKQKEIVKEIAKKNAHELLRLIPDEVLTEKDLIERFYLEVFKYRVNLDNVIFPEKEGFTAFGYNTRKFNVDQIMAAYKKQWGIDIYRYMDPAAKKIQHQQKLPKGPYAFAHRGGDKPDKQHLGKSFDDAMKEGFPFANAEEYLLMTGLHKLAKSYFMDRKGWTRISSLWSDGSLVLGIFYETYDKLYLIMGSRGKCFPDYGPRELFLFS